MRRVRHRDARRDRDADRAADLLCRVEQSRGSPASRGPTPASAAIETGMNANASPKPNMTIARRAGRAHSDPSTGICAYQISATVLSTMPVTMTGFGPNLVESHWASPATTHHRPRRREERDPGLQRRVAEDVLHVERQEEEVGEDRGAEQQRRRRSRRPASGCGRSRAASAGSSTRVSQTTKNDDEQRPPR